jgi:hypothetical protein
MVNICPYQGKILKSQIRGVKLSMDENKSATDINNVLTDQLQD